MRRLFATIALAALLASGGAWAAKRDLDVERLTASLARVADDPALATLAPAELGGARAALEALLKARGKDERQHLLYLAERAVDTVQAVVEAVQSERELVNVEREHDRILLQAAQRDAELARIETEKMRVQSMAQEEEAERAREDAESARVQSEQAARDLEAALATAEQAKRLAQAQAEETALARKEAELSRAAVDSLREQMSRLGTRQGERGLVMTLGDFVFSAGSATLQPEVARNLGPVLRFVNSDKAKPVLIEGYTDDRGSERLNLELSQKRADALRRALISGGVPAKRVKAVGRGESDPVAANDSPEGRAQNRRVEITLEESGG